MQVRSRELFTTVRSEGALLPPELLQRVADGDRDLKGLTPADYHLIEGETLGEAVNRAWTRLVGAWSAFRRALDALPEGDTATTDTRERWLLVLMQELGFGRLTAAPAVEVDDRTFAVSHGWGTVPLHLVGARVGLDHRTAGVAGAARQSPHSLVQELLNASDDRLWGIATNGLRLRLLRDNAQLARQAYVEFDLEAMMEGEVYSDFALLWQVCHQSRFEADRPEDCWLERWSKESAERGTRARESLRQGVEAAIASLGRGFLAHPANTELRIALRNGGLDGQDYYRHLLRLVYRLLFLFNAEDRELLLNPAADEEARARYTHHYSTQRLRRLAERRRGSPHPDLWRSLLVVMRSLGRDEGAPGIGLPALGSFLWRDDAIGQLAEAEIANRDLLTAVRELAFVEQAGSLRPVDYRNLGAEELGSVYESLLELHTQLDVDAPSFALTSAAGSERKTTGSYYTPTSLIVELLDSALDPVLDRAAAAEDPEAAILDLKVCDPACGSGHFLIAAAQRIAKRLASIRTGDAEPAPEPVRHALRDVVGRCIYGVDVNEMAVELCKVSLWMEALEPGRPLSFLDHRVVVGNSLLGTTPALIAGGVPDEAFTALLGDDKKTVTVLKKRNQRERGGQMALAVPGSAGTEALEAGLAELVAVPDDDIAGVLERERRYRTLTASEAHARARWAADAWCAAFVCRKASGEAEITTQTVRGLAANPSAVSPTVRDRVAEIAVAHRLLHWHVAFPDVFRVTEESETHSEGPGWEGGFDCVLGNPPWERIKLQEKEWFASRRPDIAAASNKAARGRLLKALPAEDPALWEAWQAALRGAEAESHLVRRSGRFPLCGRGDVNTYSVFAETMCAIVGKRGYAGCIVPSGIATDYTTQHFFDHLIQSRRLCSLHDYVNDVGMFPGVGHGRQRYSLLTIAGFDTQHAARFAFFLSYPNDVRHAERLYELTASDIAKLNPNTGTCPTFRSRRDAEIAIGVHRRVPVLWRDSPEENPWGLSMMTMFHMSGDSNLFLDAPDGDVLPLYEAKMMHQYTHRHGDYALRPPDSRDSELPRPPLERLADSRYAVTPRYWVDRVQVEQRLTGRWAHKWLLAWRDIARSTDERTFIATVLPRLAVGDKAPLLLPGAAAGAACLLANFNAIVLDWMARQKIGGTSVKYFIVKQLPVLPPGSYAERSPWGHGSSLHDWISARVVELTYTARDLAAFAVDMGYGGAPFRWDAERRVLLRSELDAAYFYLYGLNRDDIKHVLDSFPIVRRNDEREHGEFRTKRLILEIYDQMAEAKRTGVPYRTRLEPAPADESLRQPHGSAAK